MSDFQVREGGREGGGGGGGGGLRRTERVTGRREERLRDRGSKLLAVEKIYYRGRDRL